MAKIGTNNSFIGFSGSLIIRWRKASAPLAEVGRSPAFPFDYIAVYTINNLQPVVYIVDWYRSDDGVALSQLLTTWTIDAAIFSETTVETFQYKVDRGQSSVVPGSAWADPVDGATTLDDERLLGVTQDELVVHEAGYGNKLNAEYGLLVGGGIELFDSKTFDHDVAWFITKSKTVAQSSTTMTTALLYDGVEVISADQDFDDITTPLANKLVIANWAGSVGTINFPDLTLIADNTHCTVNTEHGSQKYVKLQFDVGDTVRYCNQDVNVIYVPKCQTISLFFFAGVCYITVIPSNALKRGTVIYDYDNSRAADTVACLLAAESTGELLESDYPGMYAHIASLANGTVPLGTSVGQWSYDSGGGVYPNKRFFGITTTGTLKFRMPHLTGMVAKVGSNPGLYEADGVGPMRIDIREGSGGSSTGPIENKGFSGQDNATGWLDNGVAGAEKYIRPHPGASAAETTVKSYGQIAYIIL